MDLVMCEVWKRRGAVALLLLILSGVPLLTHCGGKKRPPPLPPPTQTTPPPTDSAGKPKEDPAKPADLPPPPSGRPSRTRTVRLLLREGFRTLDIGDSNLGRSVRIEVTGRTLRLSQDAGTAPSDDQTTSGFRIAPAPGKLLNLSGSRYRGILDAFINPLGVPVLVNEVGLEDYLRGTVPNELHPSRFPQLAALKAQTVAARTFAVYHLGAFGKRGFDLYADERSQVYSGAKAEHPLTDRAIEETRGEVAVYHNAPILSVYSSTCGGQTESYEAVFGRKDCPYLKGGAKCSDESSPFYNWEVRTAGSKIETSLNRNRNFGRLRKLTTTKRGVSGRIIEMKMEGTKGEVILKGTEIRSVLGLRSNLVTDLTRYRDPQGYIREIKVQGRGWGHGVGLCQFGAVAMAERGRSYEDILDHYYSDIRVVRQP